MHGVVFEGVGVVGFPPRDPTWNVPHFPRFDLEAALSTTFSFDAHMQPVVAPSLTNEEGHQPRVRKAYVRDGDAYLCALFQDFDLPDHGDWYDEDEEFDTLQGLVDCAIRLGLPRPNAYSTAHGGRLVWALANPLDGSLAEDYVASFRREFKEALRFGRLTLDDAAPGWTRAYRLPRVRRGGTMSTPGFLSLKGEPLTWRPKRALTDGVVGTSVRSAGDFPNPTQLSPLEWALIPKEFRTKLRSGTALFPNGGRNDGFFGKGNILGRLVRSMACYMRPNATLLFRAVFPGALACQTPEDPEPSIQQVWDTLVSYCGSDALAYDVGQAAGIGGELPDIQAAFEAAATRTDRAQAAKDLQAMVDQSERAVAKAKNEAKLDEVAKRALTDANKPWLVYSGERNMAFYLEDDQYKNRARDVAATLLERTFDVELRTENGGLLPFASVFDRFGVYADHVRTYHWQEGLVDWYDPEEAVLHYVANRPKKIPEPVRHPEVETWLRLLCAHDDEHAVLLDWIATYQDLSKPTAALFFHGPAGTGKTMFANGISAIWGPSGKFLDNVGSNFNESLLYSPVLRSDEGLTLNSPEKVEAFKELVTARSHTINVKNLRLQHMQTCVRIVVGGNDISDLRFMSGGSSYHMDAVAERVVAIECRDTSSYLNEQNPVSSGWVHKDREGRIPGKIAEHAAWLRESHVRTTAEGRLLVDGKSTTRWRLSQSASSEDVDGGILAALAMWAYRRAFTFQGIGVNVEQYPGVVLVNASALRQAWTDLTQEREPPNARRMAKALAGLSTWPRSRSVVLGTSRFCVHAVPADLVVSAAEVAQIGDVDTIRAVLRQERIDVSLSS